MKGLTVIVPAYNEEGSIIDTLQNLKEIMKQINDPYEIIVVNDGSSDNTKALLSDCEGINLVNHKVNRGYGASLKTGLKKSKYSNICITDADGTYPNDRIPGLYEQFLNEQLDMLVGERTGKNVTYSFIRKIPKFFIIRLASYICDYKIRDINSGLRVFKKSVALKFYHLYPNNFSFTTTITMSMLCGDYDIDFTPIDYFSRVGKSKIKPIKDTINFFKLLLKIALYFNPFKFFKPIIWTFVCISGVFLYRDIFILHDLTQSSVVFPTITLLFFSIALLADLIIRRTPH